MASPALKRLMREHKQLLEKPIREFIAYPLEDNMLEWHFTMRGPDNSPYALGAYHGRVLIPSNYPYAPPDVVLITPNGRFELEKRICLSISSYHPENWQSTWGIATVLHALRDFMLSPGNNGIGAIEYPAETRRKLAVESRQFTCPDCDAKTIVHLTEMDNAPAATDADKKADVPATPQQGAKAASVPPSPLTSAMPSREPSVGPEPMTPPVAAAPNPARPLTPIVEPAGGAAAPPAAKAPPAAATPKAPTPAAAPAPAPQEQQPPQAAMADAAAQAADDDVAVPPAAAAGGDAAAAQQQQQQREEQERLRRQARVARNNGRVEVHLTIGHLDRILWIVCIVAAVILLKKAVLDAPRQDTSSGKFVRAVWSSVVQPLIWGHEEDAADEL